MRRIVASLAVVLIAIWSFGCGDDDAEPDAPGQGVPATDLDLILDFQPNAVHSGIYWAQQSGLLSPDLELQIREPGASTDAPRLLQAGRVDLAIMDIHDLAIAREAGADLVAVGQIVDRPLAAVITSGDPGIEKPADLEGRQIGVTGLPSDDAVLESVLESADLGLDDVEKVTIGFESVAALSAGKLDAATAFWNAEGVILREEIGIETTEFRVDEFGAPTYPELVIVTTPETIAESRPAIERFLEVVEDGYRRVAEDPELGLAALLSAVPELTEKSERRQLEALRGALPDAVGMDDESLAAWADWDLQHGIVEEPIDLGAAFDLELAPER